MSSRSAVILAFCVLVSVASCASTGGGPPYTVGFLKDYSKLKADPERKANWVWIDPKAEMRAYDRLMIDPVVVMPHKASSSNELGEEALRKAAAVFHSILVNTLAPYYSIVQVPGRHVLRVKIALTHIRPERDGKPGEAAIEVSIVDSQSGREVAAAVDLVTESLAGTGKYKREWRHVEGAFIEWSNSLLDYIDSYHR